MRTIAVLFCFALGALADDVTGAWSYKMSGPGGEVIEATMTLEVAEDGKLTGSFVFPQDRKLEISDGKVTGGKLDFVVKRDRGGDGAMIYKMKATVDGSKMKGTTETDMGGSPITGEWSATRK